MENEKPNRSLEKGLLAAILRKPALYQEISEIIGDNDFEWQPYAEAWRAIAELQENGMSVDILTVGDVLDRKQNLQNWFCHDSTTFTGRSALSYLRNEADPSAALTLAEGVADYSAKRQLFQVANQVAYWSANGRRAVDIVSDWQKTIDGIRIVQGAGKAVKHMQTIKDAVRDAYDATDRASRGMVKLIKTGYADIDKILRTVSGGDLVVISGRPGTGKSALLACIVDNLAQDGKRGAVFSLEMSNRQIAMRLIAMHSGVGIDRQREGKLTSDEWEKYNQGVSEVENLPIYLIDQPAISPNKIRQVLRRLPPLDYVMIDYIQIAGVDEKKNNREQEVSAITRGLKILAREFDIPFFAAAQMSRTSESRQNNEPNLSDLRESGAIENDADVVLMLWRENEMSVMTKFKIAKHRNGATGRGELAYIGHKTRFENAAKALS